MKRLPISLVLPTRNCFERLRSHLKKMKAVFPLVGEIIHVDGESTDGSRELPRGTIQHENYRFFPHPPGLYESWNFAIQQAACEFVYISTVGDLISPEGLSRLYETISECNADVSLSPPRIVDCRGNDRAEVWPIHNLINQHHISTPGIIDRNYALYYNVISLPATLIGSSASNLYRTKTLQSKLFPTDFSGSGDGMWALKYMWKSRVAIYPEFLATFLRHEKSSKPTPEEWRACQAIFRNALVDLIDKWRQQATDLRDREFLKKLCQYNRRSFSFELQYRGPLDHRRKGKPWWIMNPKTWYYRALCKKKAKSVQQFHRFILSDYLACRATVQSPKLLSFEKISPEWSYQEIP